MSKLIIVPTPVGNLEDMTFRAVRVLREAGLVLAEDTRTSGKLMKHFDIATRMLPHHQHNEHRMLEPIIGRLRSGETVAMITDAGTPGISDPGFLIVRECIRAGIDVECLPGATAFVPALVCSGLPTDRFVFEGFLPVKKGRAARLDSLTGETRTMVFYESPFRLLKTLNDLAAALGTNRPASVSREISKMHEEHVRGGLAGLAGHFAASAIKGEITIVVGGRNEKG